MEICRNNGDNSKFIFARIMPIFGLRIRSKICPIFSLAVFRENPRYCYSLGVVYFVVEKLLHIVISLLLNLYHKIPTFNNPEKENLKTLWEKEKMLVTSIFSFSHNVFYPILD